MNLTMMEAGLAEARGLAARNGLAGARQAFRDLIHQPAAHLQKRQNKKQQPADKYGAKGCLPAVSQNPDNRIGDKSILAHVRRDGKRTPGIKSHDQGAEGSA